MATTTTQKKCHLKILHTNVVEMCERPYPDVDAMNEAMIAAWNERVHGNDTVYKKFRRSESCDGIF